MPVWAAWLMVAVDGVALLLVGVRLHRERRAAGVRYAAEMARADRERQAVDHWARLVREHLDAEEPGE